ncbi:MAG: T9SS type A sorting domain-containing protein [Bacteroidia bacterium]
MKKILFTISLTIMWMISAADSRHISLTSGCSVAGTASSASDSICYEDSTILSLIGYVGTIQWQSYNGSMWINEAGTGSTTDAYQVIPGQTMQYRAWVINGACVPDSSNIVLVTVGTIPVPSGTGATRCGPGQVTLTGTGIGSLRWFTVPTGGTPVGTGSPFNVNVLGSATFYLEDNVSGGSGGVSPILVTEMDLGNNDYLELQNVSNQPVDVTGWQVAVNNSYTDINNVNANVQVLSGIMLPGDIITFTDNAAGPNYWGSNILWNPGAYPTFTGWVIILDNNNILKEFVALNWPDANIQAMNPVVNGNPITIGSNWNGNGIDITTATAGLTVSRQANSDNNNLNDFQIMSSTIGTTNTNMVLPFSGFGCSSPRVTINVTVTPSDAITIMATQAALCLGDSSTLTATSINSNYSYSWSPSTGLNTTAGPTVIANPVTTITYTVVGDDGTCANIDSISISVGPTSVSGAATISTDTICVGTTATLFLSGFTGTIQWQSFDGTNWVNETGTGNDSSQYQVSPAAYTQYRAVVTSGGCAPDTSIVISLEVLSITDPVTVNDTICGPGVVNLSASGTGILSWFTSLTGGAAVNTGTTYSPNISTTTTYYVQAAAGGTFNVGAVNNAIGNQTNVAGNNFGIQFDVIQQATIEKVYIYPQQTGTVTINLRDALGGPVLNTITANVTAFTGKTEINLGFLVNPFTGYRLELAAGSVSCGYNQTGAAYPYVTTGSPLTITGYVNPNFNTGALYYFFYDWVISEGCKSNLIPVIGVVLTLPPVPIITQNVNVLSSSSPTGNQWYLDGNIIPGATGQNYTYSQPGSYTVVVTDANGCSSTSAPFIIVGIDELPSAGISVYPNPASGNIFINFAISFPGNKSIRIINVMGEIIYEKKLQEPVSDLVIDLKNFARGSYMIEIEINNNIHRKSFLKL